MGKKTLLGSNQEIGSQNEAKKICRAQHVKLSNEIQKSLFHPPLEKGERGGFEEPWRSSHFFRLGSGHALREVQCYPAFSSFQNFKYVWLVFLVLFVTASVSAQEPLRRVRIAYPDNTICCLPLIAALQWKIFEANGLQAEIIQIRSQLAYPALAAGEVNYVAGVGPASVSATLRGMPSRAVWFATEELIYSLIARPEFQTVKDLRNKKIGLTGIGGTSHVALQVALEAVGEKPKNFAYIGLGGSQQLPALEAGTVEASLLSPPALYFAKKRGFRDLLDVGSRVKMPLGGLTVMVSTLRNRAGELKQVIKSLQSAKQEILKSREKSVALTSSFLKLDRDVAEDTYTVYRKTVSGNGVPTHEGIDQIIKSLQAAGQFTDRKVTFEEVADDRIAKEVAKELGYKIQ